MRNTSGKVTAFTLIEVMMVLAIILIIGALAYPSLESMQGRFRLDASVDQIKGRFAECRAHSIEEGTPYRFAVHPETSQYKIAPDTQDHWDNSTGTSGIIDPDAHPLMVEEEIEKDVLFRFSEGSTLSSDSTGWTTVAIFQADGTCKDDAEIRFELEGMAKTVKIRALTGIIQVLKPNTGDNP